MRTTARDQGLRWLEQARTDMKWVRHLAEQGAHYLVCFLAQQAAEKALKGVLYASGEELVLGHSVRQLSLQAARVDSAGERFASYVDRWGLLDSYYIPTRYPNGLPEDIPANVYNRESAVSALTLAEDVFAQADGWFADSED
jgi:HEPN domain-containing protein